MHRNLERWHGRLAPAVAGLAVALARRKYSAAVLRALAEVLEDVAREIRDADGDSGKRGKDQRDRPLVRKKK